MKLYLIIYTAGQIGGFAAPLPYDMAECTARRDDLRTSQAEVLADGIHRKTGMPATLEDLEGLRGISFECEERNEKPVLGDPA